jgi:hypothetical protein
MAKPYVDGRIFIRGMDGIYCYDLRKIGNTTTRRGFNADRRPPHGLRGVGVYVNTPRMVSVRVPDNSPARLSMYDSQGRRIAVLYKGHGSTRVSLPHSVAPGNYVLRLESGRETIMRSLAVVAEP